MDFTCDCYVVPEISSQWDIRSIEGRSDSQFRPINDILGPVNFIAVSRKVLVSAKTIVLW